MHMRHATEEQFIVSAIIDVFPLNRLKLNMLQYIQLIRTNKILRLQHNSESAIGSKINSGFDA